MTKKTIAADDVAAVSDAAQVRVGGSAIAVLPPDPEPGTPGAAEPAAVPLDAGSLDALTVVAGERYSKDIYVVHGYYVEVPDVDVASGEQKTADDGTPATVQIERPYDRDHYVTELGPNERGNLLVGAGTPVPAEVAALLAR